MKLSTHFDSTEFVCPCCGKMQLDPGLVPALEKLRAIIGRPIIPDSGYRCAKHNAAVGGSPNSQHLVGRAVDFRVPQYLGMEIYHAAVQIPEFHGFGVAGTWIHIDIRPGAISRWRYDAAGKQIPWG